MAKQSLSRKVFNICIVVVILLVIAFVALMFILDYDVNGETNMPFEISKISVISTIGGQDVGNATSKWDLNVVLNNDIYLYIDKNDSYKKQESISSIVIDNFDVVTKPKMGDINIYSPYNNSFANSQNLDENVADSIEFIGDKSTDVGNLKISNQGGTIIFRCANNGIGNYKSDDGDELIYKDLLNKLKVNEEDLMSEINFDVTISLNSGKVFKAENIPLKIPNKGIVSQGTVGQELNDLENVVFKRVQSSY